jgi:hypothetical protein
MESKSITAVSIAEERWDEKTESKNCKVKNEKWGLKADRFSRVEIYLNKQGFRRILAAINLKKEDCPGGNIRHKKIHS